MFLFLTEKSHHTFHSIDVHSYAWKCGRPEKQAHAKKFCISLCMEVTYDMNYVRSIRHGMTSYSSIKITQSLKLQVSRVFTFWIYCLLYIEYIYFLKRCCHIMPVAVSEEILGVYHTVCLFPEFLIWGLLVCIWLFPVSLCHFVVSL